MILVPKTSVFMYVCEHVRYREQALRCCNLLRLGELISSLVEINRGECDDIPYKFADVYSLLNPLSIP